jgi:hypothetical protein
MTAKDRAELERRLVAAMRESGRTPDARTVGRLPDGLLADLVRYWTEPLHVA